MKASIVLPVVVGILGSLAVAGTARANEATPGPGPTPILGGDLTPPCAFPTAVSVGGFCTGTLVHPQVVVYAAHCGDEVPWIRFGDRIEDAPVREVVPEFCEFHSVGEYGFGTDIAFCRLAEPIDDIPIVPPLMGCEVDEALQIGQPVTAVGFGQSDDEVEPYGIKRMLDTQITDMSWNEVFIGGVDEGVCYGDSGGPTYARLADGSWRVFGISSWGQPGCGLGGYLSTIHHNIEWLETHAEIDVTPCHDGLGAWDAGPDCGGFATDPKTGGGSWPSDCSFGTVSNFDATCGEPFDPTLTDEDSPSLEIVMPEPYSMVPLPPGDQTVRVDVEVLADDGNGWGVGEVELVILQADKEVLRIPDFAAPFSFTNLKFAEGIWTLAVEGSDRAGNEATAAPVVFGVGIQPPPPPPDEPETGTGTGATTGATTGDPLTSGDIGSGSTGEGGTDGNEMTSATEGDGCGCRSAGPGGSPWLLIAFAGLLGRRRRLAAAAVLALGACGDTTGTEEGTSAGTTTGDDSWTGFAAASTTTSEDDSGTTDGDDPMTSSSTGETEAPGCGDGIIQEGELCDDDNTEDGDGCSSDCVPSGTVIEELTWPDDRRQSSGSALAMLPGGGIVVGGWADSAEAVGARVPLLVAFTADLEVAWSVTDDSVDPTNVPAVLGITVLDDGAVIAAGGTEVTGVEPDPDRLVPWIARVEADGTLTWARTFPAGDEGDQTYRGLAALPGGDVVAVGTNWLDDDTGHMLVRRHDATTGDEVWAQVDTTTDPPIRTEAIAPTPDGGVLLGGSIDLSSRRDLWLGELDADGTLQSATTFGDPLTYHYPEAIVFASNGDPVVCGTLVRASKVNGFVIRLEKGVDDSARWLDNIEAPGAGGSNCLTAAIDEQDRVVVGGSAFHPDFGDERMFARFGEDGTRLWTAFIGTPDSLAADTMNSLSLDPDGNIVATGATRNGPNDWRLWLGRIVG